MLKANNALLELGCEEIPARFMPGLIADLKSKAEEKLSNANLKFSKVQAFGTPRRLVLFIEGLPNKQADIKLEIKGPPADIAFDSSGHPTLAAIGFAKKNNLDVATLTVKTENGKNFVHAYVVKKGEAVEKVLAKMFPEIIMGLYLPISMRWGSGDFKFIRPIHWILALYGSKVIRFQLAGVKSSNKTCSHRFFKKNVGTALVAVRGQGQALSLHGYKKTLRNRGVILDQNERREMIRSAVKKAAPAALIDNDLLEEVNYLTEYPYAIACSFDPAFLSLPKDVLVTSMKKNQKYFPVLKSFLEPKTERLGSKKSWEEPRRLVAGGTQLSNRFVVVTNGCKAKSIRHGNESVITARLSDAKFFFDEDRKIPLKARVADLKKVQFFEGLGDMQQKTARVMKLANFIAKKMKFDAQNLQAIERTAELCKADLTTQMVFEFPELQGAMGREYALLSGEDSVVAEGIFEHYLPRGAEDGLPKTVPGVIVSLADKIDTLVGCFGLQKIPTGSADPYGLRRAAYGVIKIILANKMELLLDESISFALKSYAEILKEVSFEKMFKALLEFLGGRLKAIMLEEGLSHDIIEASFANIDDMLYTYEMARVLQGLRNEDWFTGFVKTHDRAYRISTQASRDQVIEHDLVDEAEKNLFDVYLKVNWEVEDKLNKGDYKTAVLQLSKLIGPVEVFFEKVLVMHQDERIKANRLALLRTINNLFLKVADVRKIVV